MNTPSADAMTALIAHADEVLAGLADAGYPTAAHDDDIVRTLSSAGHLLRQVESVIVATVGAVLERSATGDVEARLTSRYGCHNASELIQRTTMVSPQTAARWQRAARTVHRDTSITTGEPLEAMLPAMREALLSADVGVDQLLAVEGPLEEAGRRADRDAVLAADAALADSARGVGHDGAPPACADLLKIQATAWAAILDQDGSAPRERNSLHRRFVTIGAPRDGTVPLRGNLLPEVAAQLQRIFDALCSPRVEGDTGGVRFVPSEGDAGYQHPDNHTATSTADGLGFTPPDLRNAGQKRHDALATALMVAAASSTLPTIGGAAPTLVVSVRESDLLKGTGHAYVDGLDEPLARGAAHHTACSGAIQRIALSDDGRIVRIGTEERVFNRHQRRAIALRDGGCLIPGCGVPASWCEIHHVVEHAIGGPTHTDNGVLLCWYHHRFLDSHGWAVRVANGIPEVRAPRWNDGSGAWRRVTRSKTRLATAIVQRT